MLTKAQSHWQDNTMNKRTILVSSLIIGTTALLLGAVILTQRNIMSNSNDNNTRTYANLTEQYQALYGDDFDEQYIAGMLAHHEGAVNMSEQALAKSTRPEIRQLASDIIASQSDEMRKMTMWQENWGYEKTYSGGHGAHGGGGTEMAADMVDMQEALRDKEGAAYDKEFLVQMILHHSQAVEMSRPAEKNAAHTELKMLARDVITAQESEIQKMKQWQQDWGY